MRRLMAEVLLLERWCGFGAEALVYYNKRLEFSWFTKDLWLSYQGLMADALAPGGDEGRGKLRKASGSR